MSIPNATPEQLASQSRVEQRAARLLAEHEKPTGVDALLTRRPDLSDLCAPGVVLAESARWSA